MTNPNVTRWIGSVERFKLQNQYERPFYQDEQQFYLFHPPMPTENGKQLQEYFNERSEIEKEKIKLKEEERGLVNKFDDLNRELKKVMEKEASSPEEQMKQRQEMDSINKKIQEITEKLMKVREKIEEKEEEIDKVNEKINQTIELVLKDEHELAQQEQELEKEKNNKKVDSLISQL